MRLLAQCLLFLQLAMLQQQPIRQTVVSPTIPAHPVIVDHGQIQINLHGLVRDADWVLGVVTKGNSRVTVSQVHVDKALAAEKFDIAPPVGYMTPMKSIEAWDAQHIHTRPGVVDIDGLASIAEDGVFMIYLDIPPDTKVIVNGDGPNVGLYYSGKVHGSLKLHDGGTVGEPVRSPVDVLNTARGIQTGRAPSVVYGTPGRFTANVPALRENAITLTKPQAAAVDGVVTTRLTLTPQGTVSKVEFPTGGDPSLQRAITQAVQSWRFKPWPQGEVTAVVPIQFKGGTVHGPLWD